VLLEKLLDENGKLIDIAKQIKDENLSKKLLEVHYNIYDIFSELFAEYELMKKTIRNLMGCE